MPAPTRVMEMHLKDQLTSKKLTRVSHESRQAHTVPQAWLNPKFLSRNPTLE